MLLKAIFILTIIAGRLASAEIIPNDKNSELRLGFGVDPVTDTLYQQCIDFSETEFAPEDLFKEYKDYKDIPSRNLDLKVELVTSYEQVDKYTNTSISAGVSYAAASGSFSYNKETRYSLESDRAMVGIEGMADYGRWYTKDVKVKAEYLDLYKKDPNKFYAICGKEYVSGFVAGQGLRILLATEKLSVYSYEKIAASMNASYGAGAFSGSIGASFLGVAEELSKLGSLSVNLFAFGGGPFNELSQMMESKGDIDTFRKNVAALAKEMESNRAVRIAWITQPYPGILNEDNVILTEVKRKTLRDLFQIYRKLAGSRDRLSVAVMQGMDDHLKPFCSAKSQEECAKYIELMNERYVELDTAIDTVEEYYKECVDAKETGGCRLPTVEIINVDFLTQLKWPERYKYELYQRYLEDIANN